MQGETHPRAYTRAPNIIEPSSILFEHNLDEKYSKS
jgi:hypothetical protein